MLGLQERQVALDSKVALERGQGRARLRESSREVREGLEQLVTRLGREWQEGMAARDQVHGRSIRDMSKIWGREGLEHGQNWGTRKSIQQGFHSGCGDLTAESVSKISGYGKRAGGGRGEGYLNKLLF